MTISSLELTPEEITSLPSVSPELGVVYGDAGARFVPVRVVPGLGVITRGERTGVFVLAVPTGKPRRGSVRTQLFAAVDVGDAAGTIAFNVRAGGALAAAQLFSAGDLSA